MKNKNLHLIVLAFIFTLPLLWWGQNGFAQEETQKDKLLQLSAEWQKIATERKAQAEAYARLNNLVTRQEFSDGTIIDLQFIEDGIPFYYKTENINAATTTRTNQLWPGGALGLNLNGSGYTALGEWDGGKVKASHQEFNNTGSSRITQMDGASTYSDHSTHVAGTMIAGGVSANAKGMGFLGTLKAWEWTNDASEMATAAATGLQISNHSYGYVRGWYNNGASWSWYGNPSISTTEDYLFGFYNSYTQQWDQIAYNAPYYLIVKSAGNDRLEGPIGAQYPQDGAPGGYDCIGEVGVAKNILTVGATYDVLNYTGPTSVTMPYFTCWGPADDGRIKPDIMANGVSLYSCVSTNNTSYANYSGTSMAAPNTSGTLALLQKHYQNTHGGSSMRAATLKALVIHTADETGTTTGPDYQYGWGLLNASKAAQVISQDLADNVIDELSLNNGSVYTRQVQSDGTTPLIVTICWTDPPGTPPSPSLDPITPMLVNDLDLRITYDSSTYYPWKLDRNNPVAAATNNSENNVDNIEMVYITSPAAGTYTIQVDHDGTLATAQAFSVVISGITTTPPAPPLADFAANVTTLAAGGSVSFTDLSINNPTSWSWIFNGGTPSTSTQQNPVITYNTPGVYDVSLTATNASGSDTEIKTAYITVTEPVITYCPSHGNATQEWIASVKIGTTTKTSGSSGATGYEDFKSFIFNVQKGSSYSTTFTPGFSGASKNEYWKIWIDFNHDGDFTDGSENVFTANKKKTAVTGTITIPSTALTGNTTMRVSMRFNSAPSPCQVFNAGEVEDYTVNITTALKNSSGGDIVAINIQQTPSSLTAEDILLYPSPVGDKLHVSLLRDPGNSKIVIYNIQGANVMEEPVLSMDIELNTNRLPSGVYILVLENANQPVYKKFIKSN